MIDLEGHSSLHVMSTMALVVLGYMRKLDAQATRSKPVRRTPWLLPQVLLVYLSDGVDLRITLLSPLVAFGHGALSWQ